LSHLKIYRIGFEDDEVCPRIAQLVAFKLTAL
jgi:hypothetical protein